MKTRLTNQRTPRISFAIGMAMLVGSALGIRAADASVAPIANTPIEIAAPALDQITSSAAQQLAEHQVSSADLGVALPFVSSTTTVHLPDGQIARLTGSAGVESFIASLSAEFPGVQFSVTEFTSIGNLLVFDWQGTQNDAVVFPGRTLATIENGAITDIHFLNLNNVSPVGGGSSAINGPAPVAPAISNGFFVIVDEEGRTIVPERIAEARSDGFFVIVDENGNAVFPEGIVTPLP